VPESFLAEAAGRTRGEPVLFAPSLAYFQLEGVWRSSPGLTEKARIDGRVPLAGWERGWSRPPPGVRYAVLFHRKAQLEAPGAIPRPLWSAGVVAERKRQGVWLARLVELPSAAGQGGLPGAISGRGAGLR